MLVRAFLGVRGAGPRARGARPGRGRRGPEPCGLRARPTRPLKQRDTRHPCLKKMFETFFRTLSADFEYFFQLIDFSVFVTWRLNHDEALKFA